jgi:hypothetical protein
VSYVLVSLTGDEATAANDEFARWFAKEHPPLLAFHGESPLHEDVAAGVRETKTALVLAHDGGGSIRGASQGDAWITPQQFAHVFHDARVWVYACDTRGPTLEQDLESFGRIAFESGVRVFAGHASPITAVMPFNLWPDFRTRTYQALARAFRAFIQGENSATVLQQIAKKGTVGGRATVVSALPIQRDFETLRVLMR